jgi:Zyg-11 protein homolog
MLNLINDRLTRKVFDDVMEIAWSTMWNVTDETPVNCEKFLDGKGMEYFLGCLRVSLVIKISYLFLLILCLFFEIVFP